MGFPGGSDGKRICLHCRRPGFNPWVGKIPQRRKWQPTPVFLPGKPHGQRSLVGCGPRVAESDTTEQLRLLLSLSRCHLLQHLLFKRLPFLHWVALAPSWKLRHICVLLRLGSLFYSTDLRVPLQYHIVSIIVPAWEKWSYSVKSNSLGPHGLQPGKLLSSWDFLCKNTGVGCHFCLQLEN